MGECGTSRPAGTVRRPAERPHGRTRRAVLGAAVLLLAAGPAVAAAPGGAGALSEQQETLLRRNFALCLSKLKGPYTPNFCVCKDGEKRPVLGPDGRVRSPCAGDPQFCSAYRAPWAQVLADEGMYIANLFARDLHEWDGFPDHHDLVRGYILEKFFTETNSDHKLSEMRAYGGLAGAEYEARALPRFFERYLSLPTYRDTRHYLLAYELQRRYFVRDDQGQIQKVRALASRIYQANANFKPLRDATHNQISGSLVPKLVAYRAGLRAGETRRLVDELVAEIEKLTALDEGALTAQMAEIEDAALRGRLEAALAAGGDDPAVSITALAGLMQLGRETVAAGAVSPADRRRLIDLSITAAAVLQQRGTRLLEEGEPIPLASWIAVLRALSTAAYGAGLLTARERTATDEVLAGLLAAPTVERARLARVLAQAERIVEWAQHGVLLAFDDVWAPWTFLLPAVAGVGDDVLRGSPLLLFARVSRHLRDHATGEQRIRHELFGAEVDREVRALNPGLALGRLRVGPEDGTYARTEVLALPETPAELQPAAGILTQGEGNVVSHVQLLARALGIPNVVLGSEAFRTVAAHADRQVFFIVTPGGRVLIKDAAAMTDRDRAIYGEYTRSQERGDDGALGEAADAKLHIDRARLDLEARGVLGLTDVRRRDSGVRTGPKAAFLGELKHLFPENVARGVVVPFGAYYEHYRRAVVALPAGREGRGLAEAGEPLPAFVERTYGKFFDEMIPAGTSEQELSAWIAPRLSIIQHSIQETPLAPELERDLRAALAREGLLRADEPTRTVGCFVRSDTNVEDLDNFNGAGLNLTLFNLQSVADVLDGIKQVWASPFSYRSFSWRQTLIDEPLWVLPSIVILESIYSDKSGVLVTADIDHGEPGRMLIATSEGVGGAVDGTPAETLLWSAAGVELVTQFKSPTRRLLQPGGGSALVPSTGADYVLTPDEVAALVRAAQKIEATLEPARDQTGRPRPWDIEFGFADGKLWLFQVRPFVGNDELRNVPALMALERRREPGPPLALADVVQ